MQMKSEERCGVHANTSKAFAWDNTQRKNESILGIMFEWERMSELKLDSFFFF